MKKAREDLARRRAQEIEEEKRKGWTQLAQGVFGARSEENEEKRTDSTEPSSSANRPTIGSTTISSAEEEMIKKEVRGTIQKVFPRINLRTDRPVFPNMDLVQMILENQILKLLTSQGLQHILHPWQ